jgi:PEP-CTERM/exosortase A-associated glycosyltransferase
MSDLKILHILDHSLPLHSGYSFRSHSIMRAQQDRGWTPLAVTSAKQEENGAGSGGTEEIEGIRYHRAPYGQKGAGAKRPQSGVVVALARRLREIAQKEKPHILHAHSPVLTVLPAILVGRLLSIPVVYEIRAFWEDAAVDHGTYRQWSWRYRLVRRVETWACREAEQVCVICDGLRRDLEGRRIPARKLTTVPNAVDPRSFRASGADVEYSDSWHLRGKQVIAFLGSFYSYEGLDLLVRTFARLLKKRGDVVLLLAGGGQTASDLEAQADALGISASIVMPGRISHDRMPAVYALADVLVYPRYSMRLTELVTPLKPLEAMAIGKAVIASDVGGHRELIRHMETGLLFPAGDEAALLDCIELLLGASSLRQTLGERAAAWVHRERTWAHVTEPYGDVYRSALRGGEGAHSKTHCNDR